MKKLMENWKKFTTQGGIVNENNEGEIGSLVGQIKAALDAGEFSSAVSDLARITQLMGEYEATENLLDAGAALQSNVIRRKKPKSNPGFDAESLFGSDVKEATKGDDAFAEVEAAGAAWKRAKHDKGATAAFLDAVEKHVSPEMERLGLEDESALGLGRDQLEYYSYKGGWEVYIKPFGGHSNQDTAGWIVSIARQTGKMDNDDDMDVTKTVYTIRDAVELVRSTMDPSSDPYERDRQGKSREPRAGEDPAQMRMDLSEKKLRAIVEKVVAEKLNK